MQLTLSVFAALRFRLLSDTIDGLEQKKEVQPADWERRYRRASRLFDELAQARADGTYPHLLRRLAKAQVLILDDFAIEPLAAAQRRDLLEVIEDRYKTSSTIITSQQEDENAPIATAMVILKVGSLSGASRAG